jgi:fibronectin type 3 domain-containing protein
MPRRKRTLSKAVIEALEERRLLTYANFVHPGVLNTAADFTRMATKVAANAQPWLSDWQYLQSQGYAQLGASPRPLTTVIRGGTGDNVAQMWKDIERAYDTALEWKVSGNTAYADQTVTFLNAWSYNNTTLTGDADRFLASGLYGFQWANIAEIMRTYSGWAAADQTQFANYLLNIYYPMNHDFLVNHNGAYITNYWANWDLCNMSSMMAIGVFTDRHDIYSEALNYVFNGAGNGAFDKAIYYMEAGNLGQGQEELRDQGHANLDYAMLGEICQTAWNQGDDLFSYHNNEVLAGTEYLAKYNLGNDVPFEDYNWFYGAPGVWSGDTLQTALGSGSRGQLRPIFELFYNHYVNIEGLSAPYTAQALAITRSEGDNGNGDEYSWGTLIFALDPITTPQPPQNLVGYEKGTGNVQLNWWGGANDNTYNIYRATSSSGTYTQIASGVTVFTYTDTNMPAGTYYYKVTGVNGATETTASNIVQATSSNLLVDQFQFSESSGTTASDSVGSLAGTLNGGATFTIGKTGNAVSLDGSTGYVSLPAGAIYGLSDFTIATWVYLNSAQTWARIFDFGDGRGDWMFLTARNGGGVPQFSTNTINNNLNVQSVTGNAALPTNQWVHIAVTFSNRLATMYVNGIAVGSNANMDFPPYEINGGMPNSWLGRSQFPSDPYLNAKLDDFRIYRGAMPPGQMYTLATGLAAPAAPAAPATFTATAVVGNQINLSWSAVGGATSYSLYRATSSTGPFWPIATLISGTTYSDTGLPADLASGTPYYYRVAAADAGGDGPTVSANAVALPPYATVPTNLVAKALSASKVSLNWTDSTNQASYTVRRSTISGGPYTVIATGLTSPSYTDTGLTVGTTYYYVVTAVNASGETAFSNESNATPTDLFVHLKFDDGSGTTASDESGNGWNGTLVNTPTWTSAGKVNGALTLSQANSTAPQYVTLPSGIMAGQTSFTIAAWVYLTTSTTWMRVFDFGTGTNNYMFLTVHNGSNVPRFAILTAGNSTEQGINGSAAIPTGAWTHIAVTYANNLGTLYVNGFFAGSNASMTWTPSLLGTTTQNYIGRSQWSADPYLNGSVDDFRIYAHALTSTEIRALATTAVPAAPTGLTATAVNGAGQVNLSWSTTAGATKYHVYRATTSGGPYTEIASAVTTTSYQDTNLTPNPATGTTYYYVVSAESAGGEGPQSSQASAPLLPPLPDSPTTLNVQPANSGSLALSWDAAANAAGYIIARATAAAGPYTNITTVNGATTYTDTGLTNGRTYYYTVTSTNIVGQGTDSPGDSGVATDLDDYLKFDDGTGTAAADTSGHGFIGTLVNGATWTSSSKIGTGALGLTNTSTQNQYASLPNGVVSSLTSFSIAAWVYLSTNTAWMRVFDFGTGTTNFMYLTVHNGSNVPQFSVQANGGTSYSITGNAAFPTGVWTHIAVVWNNNLGTMYVNGVFVGSNSNMPWNPSMLGTTTQNYIGHSEWTADPYLNGRIDDFRIYSRALTSTEVSTIAANMLPSAPSNLSATVGDGQANLSWNVASNATSYNIKRSQTSGGPYTTITGGIAGSTFTDTGLTDGTTYYYVVSASNVTGEGGISGQLSVVPAPLSYTGSSATDTYVVRLDPANTAMAQIFVNSPTTGSPTYEVKLAQLPSLTFDGTSGGGDTLTVDYANGNPLPAGNISFNGGGAGNLIIDGTANADSFSIDGSHITKNGVSGTIAYSNVGGIEFDLLGSNDTLTQVAQPGAPVTFNGGGGNDALNINAGTFAFSTDAGIGSSNLAVSVANVGSSVSFTGTQHLAALNVSAGATATVTPAGSPATAAVINATALSITGAASQLDLSNNQLLTTLDLPTLRTLIAGGQLWSSAAGSGGALGSMDLGGDQREVRFTLLGDTNLDGVVNVVDLANLAGNFGASAGGTWTSGDLDYNNTVNVADLSDLAGNFGSDLGFTTGTAATAAAAVAAAVTAASPAAIATTPPPPAAAPNASASSPLATFSGQSVQADWLDELLDLAE